jgi:hypothetical protein
MPATYVDQVQKLDIRSMMAAAFKADPSDHYTVCWGVSGWRALAPGQAARPSDKIVAGIQLNRTPDKSATRPWCGQVAISVVQPDGRSCEQTLWLRAARTRARRWQWMTICPFSGRSVAILYFDMAAQQFVSRQTAGLKYRQKRGKVRNYRARMLAIMRELEATQSGPWIPKPFWMAEALYTKLMQELVEMDLRRLCAALKLPRPDFFEPPFDYTNPRPERINHPPAMVIFYRNPSGVLQMKAKYMKRYGLPAGTG